ncbi:MAG: choice-of-anchor Q domain-containing protein [Pirellulales bacterium]
MDDVAGELFTTSHHNLIGVDTGLTGITNGTNGNIIGTAASPIDPMLGPLQDNGGPVLPDGSVLLAHAPLPGSPVIDAGDPAIVAPAYTDQRGYYRVVDGDGDATARIDIGAVEYASVAVLAGDGNLDMTVDGEDYLLWAEHFENDPAEDPPGAPLNGDYNGDGVVNGLDYLVWATNFGETATLPPVDPPESASALGSGVESIASQSSGGSLPYGSADHVLGETTSAVDAVFASLAVKKARRTR